MTYLGVFAFGGIGALARYALSALYFSCFPEQNLATGNYFPWPTFLINILGSFAIGCLWNVSLRDTPMLFGVHTTVWMTGLIGGFTTFSAFSLETVRLIETKQVGMAVTYATLSVLFSLTATSLALSFAKN